MAEEIAQTGAAVVDKWAERLADVMAQYGPDAATFALEVGRVGALREIAYGSAWAAVAVGAMLSTKWLVAATRRLYDNGRSGGEEIGPGILAAVFMGLTAGASIAALNSLLNLYAWVGIWRPEVYLAARALGL